MPVPKIIGLMNSQYSSIRFSCMRDAERPGLPNMMISLPAPCFNCLTCSIIFPLNILVFSNCFPRIVSDTTYLFTALYQLECSISCLEALGLSSAVGQYASINSKVFLPYNAASDCSVCTWAYSNISSPNFIQSIDPFDRAANPSTDICINETSFRITYSLKVHKGLTQI